jgi:hypothetical protein
MKLLLHLALLAGTWAIAARADEPHTTPTSGNAQTAEPGYIQDAIDIPDPLQVRAMPVIGVADSPQH